MLHSASARAITSAKVLGRSPTNRHAEAQHGDRPGAAMSAVEIQETESGIGARQLFERGLAEARAIEDPEVREGHIAACAPCAPVPGEPPSPAQALALALVGEALAALGDERGADLLDQAVAAGDDLPIRDQVRAFAAQSLAERDPGQAALLAASISEP